MSVKVHKRSCDLGSCDSTEGDSACEDREELLCHPKINPLKHKTELCKNFSETGRCPYARKCRFAHGPHELVSLPAVSAFRKKKCNNFLQNGFCTSGLRCQFSHHQLHWHTRAALLGLATLIAPSLIAESSTPATSKLASRTH